MKNKQLLFALLLFFSTLMEARTSYQDATYNHYVSVSHLHYVFNRVKETSDISQKALAEAFYYYEHNRFKKGLSPNYILIADYTKIASRKRLYIINLHTAEVKRYLVAHGLNSGDRGDRVWDAGNVMGSFKTPTGFFKVGNKEGITSKKKYDYLAVDGLGWENQNARDREIILHTAWYVGNAGRSHGCFAIKPQDKEQVFARAKNALLYSYTGR